MGVNDVMIIVITSIYHLYPHWYFTIYAKTVGNAWLLLEHIFTTHSKTTFMFRKPCEKSEFKSILQAYNLREGRLRTEIYDKRDNNSTFSIENFQFKCSNMPAPSAYGVYISQYMLYSGACGSSHVFRDRCLLLTRNILNTSFLVAN